MLKMTRLSSLLLLLLLLVLLTSMDIIRGEAMNIQELNVVVAEQQKMLQDLQSLVLHQQGVINRLVSGNVRNFTTGVYMCMRVMGSRMDNK